MLGGTAGTFSLPGKSITPRGSRAVRPSTVARFNSVSVIASGSTKLLFSSVIKVCKSAGPNELTTSSVVGDADGELAGAADDFEAVCGAVPGGVCGGNFGIGDCAARVAVKIERANAASKSRDITISR